MRAWNLVLVVALLLSGQAQASGRLGGGKSVGTQSSNVTQRQQAPTPTQKPTNVQQTPPNANPAAVAAAPAKRPWGAMLGGLAAGLGLAWLAQSMGFGEGLANVMLVLLALVVIGGTVVFFLRLRRPTTPAGGLAYAAAGPEPQTPREYSPDKVGNDASARPWERNSMSFDARSVAAQVQAQGVRIGAGLGGSPGWGAPEGFDASGFLEAAKRNFVTLQSAWDRADVPALRVMMTDEMVAEIKAQLAERECHTGGQTNTTEVVMLQAQLLGVEELADQYLASVEFSGMIREDPSAGPNPFREVWNMSKPRNGRTGWLVAGVQALQ